MCSGEPFREAEESEGQFRGEKERENKENEQCAALLFVLFKRFRKDGLHKASSIVSFVPICILYLATKKMHWNNENRSRHLKTNRKAQKF